MHFVAGIMKFLMKFLMKVGGLCNGGYITMDFTFGPLLAISLRHGPCVIRCSRRGAWGSWMSL